MYKFPVQGQLDEYKVVVKDKYVVLGLYEWEVNIYKYNPSKLFFKHKKLYSLTTGYSKYRDYIGKYIELANLAVKDYEGSIIQEKQDEINHQKGLKEFDLWDGKLT